MRLDGLGLRLRDVDLGTIDAESDHKLADDFVITPYVKVALEGRRSLFLGRKGAGKSAVFVQLPRLIEQSGDATKVVSITPDQYAWSALRQYEEQGLLAEQAHTNAWKLTLAIEMAGYLASLDQDWLPGAEEARSTLQKFLSDNYGGTQLRPNFTASARSLLRGLRSFNLSAFGFGAGAEIDRSEQPLTPAVIEAILEALASVLTEQPLVVQLDRLDDSWDGSDQSRTLLIGLLKAAKELNDRFRREGGALRVLTFLRSDIYNGLQFDDKDKHRPTEEHLLWSPNGLAEMLDRRLPEKVGVDDLFEAAEMRGRLDPFNYIVKRTFLRPREVLQFVGECIKREGSDATEISKDSIRAAEHTYSRWKVDDLKQEFRRVAPEFEALLEALRQKVHRYDTLDQLADLLANEAEEAVESRGRRGALELLFDASVVGIRLGGAGATRFKADDPELALPAEGTVYVHQSLYKGLNIVEARRASSEADVEEDEAVRA